MKKLLIQTISNSFYLIYFLFFIFLTCSSPESKLQKNIKDLGSIDYEVREKAAKNLGETKDPKAVEPLIKALNDEDYGVRKTAAIALGKIGDAKAVEPLINLFYDKESIVIKAALAALTKIGEPSIEPLARILRTGSTRLKMIAADGLGSIGGSRATDALINASRDSEPKVRKAVILALVKINDSRSFEAISNMMNDEDSDVANTAAQSLRRSETEGLKQVRRLIRNRGF